MQSSAASHPSSTGLPAMSNIAGLTDSGTIPSRAREQLT